MRQAIKSAVSKTLRMRDSHRLRRRFPFMKSAKYELPSIQADLRDAYSEYVASVSTADMAVSLPAVAFLTFLCRNLCPKRVLDLGSGFSSYALRIYAATSGDAVTICSVDDSPEWLDKTREFLRARDVNTERFLLWEDFSKHASGDWDLIFHDLGSMDTRRDTLDFVLQRCHQRSAAVLDDMHKPDYADYVRDRLKKYRCRIFDSRAFTLDELGRFSTLVTDIEPR